MRFAASLLIFFSLTANAAPFAVQVGDTRIVLDTPAGFSDTGFTGSPRLQEIAEALTSPSNRILLFALTDGDLRRFMSGDSPDLKRQTLIATPRGLEQDHMRPEAFAAYVSDALRELGAPPAAQDYRQLLDAQPGRLTLLAELRRDASAAAILQGVRLPSPPRGIFADEKPAQYMLTTTTLLLVRSKPLNLRVFASYESPADMDWLRATTLRWVDDLQKLNSR